MTIARRNIEDRGRRRFFPMQFREAGAQLAALILVSFVGCFRWRLLLLLRYFLEADAKEQPRSGAITSEREFVVPGGWMVASRTSDVRKTDDGIARNRFRDGNKKVGVGKKSKTEKCIGNERGRRETERRAKGRQVESWKETEEREIQREKRLSGGKTKEKEKQLAVKNKKDSRRKRINRIATNRGR